MKIQSTRIFRRWLDKLRDNSGRARIQARIKRLAKGQIGQFRRLKFGVSELKVDSGPGYRVYFLKRPASIILLLCGGDKSSQQRDIKLAYMLARSIGNENGDSD